MTAPTFAKGDPVMVRNARGLWRIEELRLVADEAVVVRGLYGQVRRTVPAADLLPAPSRRRGTR